MARRDGWGVQAAAIMWMLLASPAAAASFAYVTNSSSDTVWVIDTETGTVRDIVDVGSAPFGVAVHPNGTRVYVTNQNDNSLSVIDTATDAVIATIPLESAGGGSAAGSNIIPGHCGGMVLPTVTPRPTPTATPKRVGVLPDGIALNQAGTTAYVATIGGIAVIDTATNTVTASVAIVTQPDGFSRPHGVTADPSDAHVYVTVDNGFGQPGSLAVLDTRTETVSDMVSVGEGPFGVAVDPLGARAYVANMRADTVSVVDISSSAVSDIPVGPEPFGVAVSPDGERVLVSSRGSSETSGSVAVIDPTTMGVVATIPIAGGASGIAFDLTGGRAYAVNVSRDALSVIDTVANTVLKTIGTGVVPVAFGSFVVSVSVATPAPTPTPAPGGELAFVANTGSNDLSMIDTVSNQVVATVAVGQRPDGLAVAPSGARAFVLTTGSLDSGNLRIVDLTAPGASTTLNLDNGPQGLVITPDGGTIYVSGYRAIAVVDTTSATVTAELGASDYLGEGPIAISPDGGSVYVTTADVQAGAARIFVIDTRTRAITDSFLADASFGNLAISRDGRTAYAVNTSLAGNINIIDLTTHSITDRLYLQLGVAFVGAGAIVVSPRDPFAYIVGGGWIPGFSPRSFAFLQVLDTQTKTALPTSVPLQKSLGQLVFVRHGDAAYVTDPAANTVLVVDTAASTLASLIPVGSRPGAIAVAERSSGNGQPAAHPAELATASDSIPTGTPTPTPVPTAILTATVQCGPAAPAFAGTLCGLDGDPCVLLRDEVVAAAPGSPLIAIDSSDRAQVLFAGPYGSGGTYARSAGVGRWIVEPVPFTPTALLLGANDRPLAFSGNVLWTRSGGVWRAVEAVPGASTDVHTVQIDDTGCMRMIGDRDGAYLSQVPGLRYQVTGIPGQAGAALSVTQSGNAEVAYWGVNRDGWAMLWKGQDTFVQQVASLDSNSLADFPVRLTNTDNGSAPGPQVLFNIYSPTPSPYGSYGTEVVLGTVSTDGRWTLTSIAQGSTNEFVFERCGPPPAENDRCHYDYTVFRPGEIVASTGGDVRMVVVQLRYQADLIGDCQWGSCRWAGSYCTDGAFDLAWVAPDGVHRTTIRDDVIPTGVSGALDRRGRLHLVFQTDGTVRYLLLGRQSDADPTPGPGSTCVGDCSGDGAVTIDELMVMVNIALQMTPLDACAVGDDDADGMITVDEILRAVANALAGCPTASHGSLNERRTSDVAAGVSPMLGTPPHATTGFR